MSENPTSNIKMPRRVSERVRRWFKWLLDGNASPHEDTAQRAASAIEDKGSLAVPPAELQRHLDDLARACPDLDNRVGTAMSTAIVTQHLAAMTKEMQEQNKLLRQIAEHLQRQR